MFGHKSPAPPPQTLDLRAPEPQGARPKRGVGRNWLIAGVIVAGGIVAAVLGSKLLAYQSDPFPSSIREAAEYPLYYARTLPSGFILADGSPAKMVGGVASLTYRYDGHPLVVNMQSRPKANLPEPFRLKDVDLSFGHGYVANINGNPAGVIETDKTLVFITSEDKLDADVIVQLMRSLAPAN